MRRLIKWLGIAFLTVVFLAIVVLGLAYYYKSDILTAVNQELNKSINGDVALEDITFSLWDESPGLSITLHNVSFRGPHYDRFHKDFFKARKVHISVRLMPLLRKTLIVRSIRITDGSIFIYRTKLGETNQEIFKTKKDTVKTNPVAVFLKRLRLEDVQFSFQDSLKKKSIGFQFIDLRCEIIQSDSTAGVSMTGPMSFQGIMLNAANGSYLKNKQANVHLDLMLITGKQKLVVRPSTLEFERSTVRLAGSFDLGKPGAFELDVGSNRLDYEEGLSLITEGLGSKLVKIKMTKPLDLTTRIKGQLGSASQPQVNLNFTFSKNDVNAFGIAAKEATVVGSFTNQSDSTQRPGDENARITLNQFDGVFHGLKTSLEATFYGLKDPRVEVHSSMDVPLSDFKPLVDPNLIKLGSGRFTSSVTYKGMLHEFLDTTRTQLAGKLAGTGQIKDGTFVYVPRRHSYEKVNVALHFDQNHVGIENVSFLINKSPISLKGELLGFVPFLVLPTDNARAVLSIYSPSLNIQSLLTPAAAKKPAAQTPPSANSMNHVIEKILQTVSFELNVQLDRLGYDKMNGTNVYGKFLLKNYNLIAEDVNMNLADGKITFAMSVNDLNKPLSFLWVKSIIRHADIKKFFYSFNNFKLTTITYQNLEGKIDMNSIFRSQVDDNFNLVVPSLYGNLDMVIRDGKLINFEPLENMSNFLLKKRDFSNVQFGEIKTHLTVKGKEFDIEKMEIESTVLRLFVEGRYSLAGHTDMSVQIPLSNLKKRDKDYKPENVGIDQKVGPSVFLHVHNDEKGNTVIAYDPFKRHTRKAPSKEKAAAKQKASGKSNKR